MQNLPKKLPEIDGYTMDTRLREFRKMICGQVLEFIPFDSEEGYRLLNMFKAEEERVIEN
jgi:hypothetical protein